jgi:exonuclease VII small subunit
MSEYAHANKLIDAAQEELQATRETIVEVLTDLETIQKRLRDLYQLRQELTTSVTLLQQHRPRDVQ